MRIKREYNFNQDDEGAYYPGVFIIKLKKILHEEVQYDDFDEEDWQTFVHEYIHFLQDISTGHGFLYFFFKSQLLNLAFYSISNSSSDVIKLPLRTEEMEIQNASEKEMLLDYYMGDNKNFRYHHINEIKVEHDEMATELVFGQRSSNQKLLNVNIYYDDKDHPYHFGNVCVIESMAYLIEHHLFGAEERKNEFPYNACEVICQVICPNLLKYPKRIVMLAEVALMFDDCGLHFLGLARLCEKTHLTDLLDNDFRDFCIRNINAKSNEYEMAYKQAKEGIDILYPSGFPYTIAANEQIKVFLKCGHNYRLNNPLFISDSFDVSDPKLYFMKLINLFGIPVLIDGNEDYYGKMDIQNIPVPDAVLSILMDESDAGCSLQTLCRRSGITTYDKNRCTKSPWDNCMFSDICPIAVYFKGYGVDGKKYRWRLKKDVE